MSNKGYRLREYAQDWEAAAARRRRLRIVVTRLRESFLGMTSHDGQLDPIFGDSAPVFPTPGSSFTVLGNLRTDIELLITDLRPDDVR